jgi:hypothetical protein
VRSTIVGAAGADAKHVFVWNGADGLLNGPEEATARRRLQ